MGVNGTPQRINRAGIDWYTPYYSGSVTIAVAICTSKTPPYVCIWNGSIVNIWKTTTPSFRETSELHNSIERRLSNDSNDTSVSSKIFRDKLSVTSGRNIKLCCKMDVAAETVQPIQPQIVSHGLPTIDASNENSRIWSPTTSEIRGTPNNTHESASGNVLFQERVVVESMGNIERKTTKLILKLRTKTPNFKEIAIILKLFDHLWIQTLLVRKRQMKKHQQ